MIVVSDTSPICYLVLIGEIELLPKLYDRVIIPKIVQQELSDERSPVVLQDWIKQPPEWLIIQEIEIIADRELEVLDAGEKAAIILAEEQKANLIVIDDGLARKIALERGLKVTGLLGVLDEAAKQNLINFPQTITRLQKTSFRASSKLIQALLQQYR